MRVFVSEDLLVVENDLIAIISLRYLLAMSCSERLLSASVGNRELGDVPV